MVSVGTPVAFDSAPMLIIEMFFFSDIGSCIVLPRAVAQLNFYALCVTPCLSTLSSHLRTLVKSDRTLGRLWAP